MPVINGTSDGHGAVVTGNIIISRGPGVSFYDSSGHSVVKNWIAARQGGISISYATGSVISVSISDGAAPVYSVRTVSVG